jgi:hypothetical protein
MVYSLDVYIICNNQTILDKILAKLPPKTNPQVWPDDYRDPTQTVDDSANKVITAMIRLNQDNYRSVIMNDLGGEVTLGQIYDFFIVGSWIRFHKCFHDEGLSCPNPPQSVFEVVDNLSNPNDGEIHFQLVKIGEKVIHIGRDSTETEITGLTQSSTLADMISQAQSMSLEIK